jgi:hypothetical protein
LSGANFRGAPGWLCSVRDRRQTRGIADCESDVSQFYPLLGPSLAMQLEGVI